MKKQGGQLKHKVKIEWSQNFAYAIGLIASDGSLNKDGRHINFVSKESEMINNFKQSLLLSNQISKRARGGETEKKYFSISFGDKVFYKFLNSIGLWAKKSKTIQQVSIPDEYFKDFLRGLFDGDGSFHIFWDKRWPNSFGYKIFFYSASKNFLDWLKNRLTNLYEVKGLVRHHKGAGVYGLQYVKGDSRKLFNAMHEESNRLFLKRKYDKINNAIQFDRKIKVRLPNIKSFRFIKNLSRTSSSVRALP